MSVANQIPHIQEALLQIAESTSKPPMALLAIEHFKPLDAEQIRNNAEKPNRVLRQFDTLHMALSNSGCFTGKNHFTLILNQEFLVNSPTVTITNCSHFTIRISHSTISLLNDDNFFITISDCAHFSIEGLSCGSGRNILYISGSSNFAISSCKFSDSEGYGIIIHNSHNFKITDCFFRNMLAACILIVGNSYRGAIRDCYCSGSRGFFNHDAGIHLCSTSPDITSSHIPQHYHEPLPIDRKTQRPHHIIIDNCTITHCRAQGIYLEGAINCLVENNLLVNNNKEGICFDWGSCYNIFRNNIVSLNGERRNLSQDEINIDYIGKYPLLKDGSSSMKLPGVALDNGCLNLIDSNKIANNYGGGIKMVRTAMLNTIHNNQITGNAVGANRYVSHFHGITFLGLGTVNNEFNSERSRLLDFMPSILNKVKKNIITEHSSPVFCDKISSNNEISLNTVSQKYGLPKNRRHRIQSKIPAKLRRYFHRLKKFYS